MCSWVMKVENWVEHRHLAALRQRFMAIGVIFQHSLKYDRHVVGIARGTDQNRL